MRRVFLFKQRHHASELLTCACMLQVDFVMMLVTVPTWVQLFTRHDAHVDTTSYLLSVLTQGANGLCSNALVACFILCRYFCHNFK